MNPYPLHLVDTRLLDRPSEESTAYRCKVIQGVTSTGEFDESGTPIVNYSGADLTVPWGQIGVCFSDLTCEVYAPEDAETYWAAK